MRGNFKIILFISICILVILYAIISIVTKINNANKSAFDVYFIHGKAAPEIRKYLHVNNAGQYTLFLNDRSTPKTVFSPRINYDQVFIEIVEKGKPIEAINSEDAYIQINLFEKKKQTGTYYFQESDIQDMPDALKNMLKQAKDLLYY